MGYGRRGAKPWPVRDRAPPLVRMRLHEWGTDPHRSTSLKSDYVTEDRLNMNNGHDALGAETAGKVEYWPLQAWAEAFSKGALTLARSPAAAAQLDVLRTGHDALLDEAKEFFDRRCTRQLDTVEGAVKLAEELRTAGLGPQAMSAWLTWYISAMDNLANDAKDQMQLASKTAKCCFDVMSAGVVAGNGSQAKPG